jgi:hypothetical protein
MILLLTISFLRSGMSMIPAHLLDLVQPISFHPTVQIQLDGGAEGVSTSFLASNPRRIEALFSDAHRSRRTTPVTKATSGRGSSWDDSDSKTIHRSDDPLFNVAELNVVRSEEIEEILENFEEVCDLDTPLKFRPFMAEFMGKLRRRLSAGMDSEYVLTDDAGFTPTTLPRFDVTFPVKHR